VLLIIHLFKLFAQILQPKNSVKKRPRRRGLDATPICLFLSIIVLLVIGVYVRDYVFRPWNDE
jgi:hypothetical protein